MSRHLKINRRLGIKFLSLGSRLLKVVITISMSSIEMISLCSSCCWAYLTICFILPNGIDFVINKSLQILSNCNEYNLEETLIFSHNDNALVTSNYHLSINLYLDLACCSFELTITLKRFPI